MSKKIFAAIFVSLLTVLFCGGYLYWGQVSKANYPIKRVIQYSFDVHNTTNKPLHDAQFSVYAPVKTTATQRLGLINASHDYKLEADALNNNVMHFRFPLLAPYETKIIRIRAEIFLSDAPNILDGIEASAYLGKEQYMEVDHPAVQAVAKNLLQDDAYATSKNILNWVSGEMEYSGYIRDDLGALYALENKSGDCTEYMYLYNALSRVNNIPARNVGGYVYSGDATLNPQDYHNWSEVFIDGRWRIVDAQNGVFMENQSHYIAMRIISAATSSLLGSSQRFVYSSDDIKVTMR